MNAFLAPLTRGALWLVLGLLLALPAAAFELTYSPTNTQPGTVYFNGTATQLADRFQLTPYQGSSLGSMVLDNLPKTPIKAFTVRFGLQMTNTFASSVMADGFSFNFGPGITTDSVASEKGITNGLAVAFDTYKNNTDPFFDPDWVPGISIRWNGADLATTNVSSIFNSLKTTTNFYDVIITLQAPQSEGGLSTVTVEYQGVVLSAQIQYSPTSDQTWRMMFAARTGGNWSQQAINQIYVSGTATELTVFSPYGKGQTTPAAGTFNLAAFAYTYDPATLPAGTMSFNGAAANRTNLFLLTPNQNWTNGSITLNNLPQVPITEFTARLGLRMANYTNRPLADGVSINFGPRIATNALVDETGITTGLAVCFDTYRATGEDSWVPGLAIRWNKTNIIASTNIWPLFQAGQTSSNFNDVTITLQPLDNSAGLSTVTVEYQGVTLSGQVPYAPATNEPWGVILGARTGLASSEQALNRIQLSGTSLQPAAAPAPVGDRLTPSPGLHEITEKAPVVLQAPDYVYLDRYRRELDPTPENINSIAHYRARLDSPAATVTPSGGAAAYGIANGASINLDRDTTVTWHWVVDNLAEVDSGTSSVTNLSATDITDAAHVDTLGRRYLPPGTTGFDSLVYRSVTAAQQGNVRFGSRGYVMENAPNSPERYLELAGEGDHLRTTAASPVLPAGATNYTLEFWARRNVTTGDADQVVLGLGSANGAGRRLLAGFGGDRGFFVSDGAVRVTALPGWTDEEWHHWAAVCRGTGASNSVALYRDGVLVQQTSDVLAPFGGDGTVTIGARAVGDYATAFFSGGVNNVRVWGRTLERTNLYVALATKQFSNANPDLLLEMPFDTAPTNAAAGVHVARLNYPIDTNPGALRFETWDGLSTTDNSLDSTLLVDPRYPNYPSFATFTPTFDSRPVYPDNSHDGYGGRISGWIIPQETANYRFFLKCDDSARLFLSPDDDPNHLVQVAYLTSFNNAFAEPAANNPATTALIGLQAGRRYAVMALWKESAGNDFCTVAWRKDGDPTPATSLTPVPGSVLSAPSFATPAFTQLAGATVVQSYQAANFLLPSTNAVPLRPPGFGSDAWHHRSRLVAAAGGRYTFTLQAGGPAQCWVDGRLLINRPTTNSPATASVSLTPGSHVVETWMMDPGGPRALSLTYSPDSVTTPAALPDSSLFLAASDLLALGQVTTTSTEGKGLVFVARGFEGLFPANTAGPTLLAAIMPGFRLGLTALEGGQNSVQIDPIGKAPLNDWRRVFWGWKKEFQFTIGVMCVDEDGLPVVSKLPYFAGEVAEANVDGSTSETAAPFGSGVVNVHNLWLQEGERLSVGTIYRTLDRRFTLDGISGNLNAFSDITLDKLIDAFRSNGVSREYLFPGVFGPGSLNFSYGRTIHRVNIPLGQGFDVSSLAAVNAVLYPELPEGATNLLVNQDGPGASETTPSLNGTITGGSGAGWMWDFVGKKWHPTKPGQFTLSWPDVAGYTNQIEVHAGFPGDTEVYSGFLGFENKDGTRQGSATNRNRYSYTYPGVATNYPGAPAAHYTYNIAPDGALPAPADLDPNPNDGWFFKEFSYAENNTAQVANKTIFTDTGASNRSVFVWTRRLDPAQIATGDLARESIVVRVSQSQARTNQAAGVVGARLESPDDLAGFHSGRITPTANSRNYNPSFYDTNAAVGQWGPVYPVNHWASSNQVGQSLMVDWYYNTATLIAGEPVSYKPRITTTYTNLSWPDATNPATPVIYISSQMGSEGVGQAVSTNDRPNYQDLFDPAKFANLAIYNQPDRNAIGYNPNEEHALIAPSKAYVLTGDPRFNLGQNAAFALQNGLNHSNKDGADASSSYTSDPFVLVQYSVPGATNASDAFGMKVYAVQAVRTNATAERFPRVDVVTGTAFETSGQPVPQPANPTYAFQYTAVAGSVVTPPYPLALVIGNVVLPNTVGGNLIDDNTANPTRSLWQDKNGTHWVVSGGGNARFFERYFYPLRADFWLKNDSGVDIATGTPIAWAPPGAVPGTAKDFYAPDAKPPVAAKYQAVWGNQYPVLKRGETLTYAGGEYKADHPASPGLPAVVNMASAQVVFDSSTPSMVLNNQESSPTHWTTLVPGVRTTTYNNDGRKDGYIESITNVFSSGVASEADAPNKGSQAKNDDVRGFSGDFSVLLTATSPDLTIPDLLPRSKELGSDQWNKRTFAYWMRTLLKIDVAGSYTFYLQSGDGSRLYLSKDPVTIVEGSENDTTTSIATSSANSPLLVDADGHIEYNNYVNQEVQYIQASGTQDLSPGYYVLQVQYFQQGPKNDNDNTTTHPKFALQYECLSAGINRQAIPAGQLFRDPYDEDLDPKVRRHYPEVQPFTSLSARVTRPLDRYAASISKESIPQDLQPANPAKVLVSGSRWYFKDLSASLGQRFYYDSLVGQLVFRGRLNNLESGAPDLTRQPVQPYVLEPNFLTDEDVATLKALTDQPSQGWSDAIDQLQVAASTEFTTGSDTGLGVTAATGQTALAFYTNTVSDVDTTPADIGGFTNGVGSLVPISSFGIGSALVPSPSALDNTDPVYVTLAENNDPRASGAVALHIIQLSEERYRGSIQVLTPQDAFSEKINLKHTGDFGGNTAEIYYQWWVSNVTPLDQASRPDVVTSTNWQVYKQGLGLNSIAFEGDPITTLADKFFFVRYGGSNELYLADNGNRLTTNGSVSASSWRQVLPDSVAPDWTTTTHGVPYQWAGAANSPQLQADGSKRYLPQLVMGWVKRVLDQINPFEARYSATFNGDAPATYASMLQQAGGPYIGPVALNSDKNNLENVGLIALYETVLQRAKDLTTEGSDAGTDQALLLAATRLASLYSLLGNEAWSDAQTGILPQSPDLDDDAASYLFAFKNEVATPLDEQLALLRGTDFLKAYPSFNRLFWNYLKADGEAAYNAVYNISDANSDGLIDESDAAIQYPMGHGDAWGHYLSAVKMHYDLLRRPGFTWQARAELYSLLGNVLPVDYLDEKTFATLAAARARAGVSILKATYAQSYSSDPAAQWQGYTDTANPARAWGVSEWTRRTGHGAWFDWLAANAMTPAPGTNAVEGLDRIDRAANQAEVATLTSAFVELQEQLDNANRGQNPIGLDADAMAFDIDPFYDGVWWERAGQFQQVYDRAVAAANNALAAYNFARRSDQQLRRLANDTAALKTEALKQDLDYRNRLIAIYGRPYQGTVGPGKIFAEGYEGPDLVTYMYMDVLSAEALMPQVQGRFVWQQSLDNDVVAVGNGLDFQVVGFNPNTGDQIGDDQNQFIFDNFYLSGNGSPGRLILDAPNHPGDFPGAGDTVVRFDLPYYPIADWALQSLPDWGSRPAYGSIQSGLNDILATQVELEVALESYHDYLSKMEIKVFYARQKMDALSAKLLFAGYYEWLAVGNVSFAYVLTRLDDVLKNVVKEVFKGRTIPVGIGAQGAVVGGAGGDQEVIDIPDRNMAAIPNNFTLAGGGDIFSPLRVLGALGKTLAMEEFEKIEAELARLVEKLELETKISEIVKDAGKEVIESYNEFLDVLKDLSLDLAEEETQRAALMAPLQKLNWAEVSTQIAEGERLQMERAALNRQIAASAQRNRYADLVVRLTRNEAVRKFDAALDNALRYAWLAAKAYDYETSLSEGHPAGINSLLDQIVQTRSLGLWEDGQPKVGNGGLGELLARLKSNHDALKGQIGLNNAQFESSLFSLRTEAFRISTDQAWVNALKAARVPDLWAVPEFRQYCRPFAHPTNGAQPGLVIQFSTEINPGLNFFGRPLSALDHSFSGANYATKIRELGVAFPGYDEGASQSLSISPRIYLLPVGQDVQRCSDTRFPTVRSWNVVSQRIPTPYVLNTANLRDINFQPSMDGLDGSYVDRIRFGDFRAFTTDGDLNSVLDLAIPPAPPGWSLSARLYGRSVWNTRWLLIIPGTTLSADPNAGLDRFINTVTDIKLLLQTYSNMGM